LSSTFPARVSRVDRGAADLLAGTDSYRAEISWDVDLAVGDWVDTDGSVILAVHDRHTAIVRGAASGESRAQTLVANVDIVFVAVPATPAPKLGMVERLVSLGWDSGATPVVVITKSDLAVEADRIATEVAASAPGCETHLVSAATGEGMDAVLRYDVPDSTLCLIGRSGAGKSTLANALAGEDLMAVSEVRNDGKGRHTTTHRELIVLPGGGVLVDTPGLRGVGMWTADDGIEKTFPEIEALAGQCRFGDCAHDTEPGCAVQSAIAAGELPQRRLDSWRKLGREIAWMESRHDARLRQERAREWKRRSRLIAQDVKGRTRP
jgi:ribosome biogenesis GTPase